MSLEGERVASEPVAVVVERHHRLSTLTLWLLPLLAMLLGLWLTWQHYEEQGPEITITFATADGLEARATKIKYKDVVIGEVTAVELLPKLDRVAVTARMVKQARPWLTAETRFWVVRPQASLQGISGLNALFSGTYIQADVVLEGETKRSYTGLDTPPQTESGAPGMRLRLQAQQAGSISVGAPVYFRQIPVGRIESRQFIRQGGAIEFGIFIDAPFHQQVSDKSRFWNVSGFQATVTSEGVQLQTHTLESLLVGGVAFDHLASERGEAVAAGDSFILYANEAEAREQRYAEQIRAKLSYQLFFEESVRGLNIGAAVEYLGVPVGQVVEVNLRYRAELRHGVIAVVVELEPERFGLEGPMDYRKLLQQAIANGLHGQLQSSSLLTGQLIVALQSHPDSEAKHYPFATPLAQIPTVSSDLTRLTRKANSMLDQWLALPLDEIVASVNRTIKATEQLLSDPTLQAVPQGVNQTLHQLRLSLQQLDETLTGFDRLVNRSESFLTTTQSTLQQTQTVLEGIGPDSVLYFDTLNTLKSLDEASRAVEELMRTLERNPKAIFGES
ncbi:MCE family protein [Ectothiorhodospiraceae bacterium BW-2]|nr:MCE family protein [Ectothiorhodospiraceae bacterium BW-2]